MLGEVSGAERGKGLVSCGLLDDVRWYQPQDPTFELQRFDASKENMPKCSLRPATSN